MSYNCRAEYLGEGRLRIKQEDFDRLFEKYDEYQGLAESNFVTDRDVESSEIPGELIITDLRWSGEWSGNGMDVLKDELLPLTMGSADILFTWEGGDSHSGLRVQDGKVTECNVVFALQPIEAAAKAA